MLHRLKRTLALILLFANIIAGDDDVSVEIEGLSNFFNPFNWFGEDSSASEAPERMAPQPNPALQPEPAPSEPLGGSESVRETNESEVRIEGAPRDNIASMTPVNLNRGFENPANNNPNNIARLSGAPSNNVPNSLTPSGSGPPHGRLPYRSPTYGNPPYGRPPYGNVPQGHSTYGNAPWGNSPYGNAPRGNSPYGNAPRGNSPYGNAPQGPSPYGNAPYRGSPYGNSAYGASNPYSSHIMTRNADPQPNPRNYRAAGPDPSSHRNRTNKKRGKLILKPKEESTSTQ